MLTFHIYCIVTFLTTFYFYYNLYLKENQLYIFSMYIVKSKFHFCLLVNFVVMILISCGKIIIKLFFDEIRLSEMIVIYN